VSVHLDSGLYYFSAGWLVLERHLLLVLQHPFIDDNASPDQKTAWLSVFYMCIPTGIAIGYVYRVLFGSYVNWHVAF